VVSFLVGAFILRVRPVPEEAEESTTGTAVGTIPGLAD